MNSSNPRFCEEYNNDEGEEQSMSTYTTRDEAIGHEIVNAIEAGGAALAEERGPAMLGELDVQTLLADLDGLVDHWETWADPDWAYPPAAGELRELISEWSAALGENATRHATTDQLSDMSGKVLKNSKGIGEE